MIQGDPKRYVPMKISIVALIKKLFISNYNHTLFSLWKTIHQSFSYFCQFLVNLWLSQDVFIIFEPKPKRPDDPVLAHGHPGSTFNGMKRSLKHFFWNLRTPKNIVFAIDVPGKQKIGLHLRTKRSQESLHHFQAHYRTIHTLLLAFPCQHQLIFALFGSCMGIGADQT